MGIATSAQPQSQIHAHDEEGERRHPAACAVLTIAVAGVFWVGLIWAAVRIYG